MITPGTSWWVSDSVLWLEPRNPQGVEVKIFAIKDQRRTGTTDHIFHLLSRRMWDRYWKRWKSAVTSLTKSNWMFCEGCVVCFTEAGLGENVPDYIVGLSGFRCVCVDYKNNRFSNSEHITEKVLVCSPDIINLAACISFQMTPLLWVVLTEDKIVVDGFVAWFELNDLQLNITKIK